MTPDDDKYREYVDHPRYGHRPNYTGLNPDHLAPEVSLHWNSTNGHEIAQRFQALTGQKWPYGVAFLYARDIKRIPNTAVVADSTRQTIATVPVTHYFDLDRVCRECGKRFIFFAEEQKYWYEDLGFGLDSDCVRCVPCRKRQQGIAQKRQRYETLFHISERNTEENLELADCCLSLIESSVFTVKQLQRVRSLLNRIPADADETTTARHNELAARVRSVEARNGEQPDAPDSPIRLD